MKTTYLNYNYNTSLVFVENEQDKSLFSNPCFWVDIALTVVYQINITFDIEIINGLNLRSRFMLTNQQI